MRLTKSAAQVIIEFNFGCIPIQINRLGDLESDSVFIEGNSIGYARS